MMQNLHLEIVTPEQSVVKAEVEAVVVPGVLGQFGILPGHTTLLAEVGTGTLTYSLSGQSQSIYVSGGFAEIIENRVTVLADTVSELSS